MQQNIEAADRERGKKLRQFQSREREDPGNEVGISPTHFKMSY